MAKADIEEELTCPVCLDFYKDPRLLPCRHSLCKSCIVALYSKKENIDHVLQCPSCRRCFEARDDMRFETLPENFTLASIVYKFQESMKGDKGLPCDLCEVCKKEKAIKKCLQCRSNYCRMCLEQKHPRTGVLANHKFEQIMGQNREKHEYKEYDQTRRARYCMTCDEICIMGDQHSKYGKHEHHDITDLQSALRQRREEFVYILGRLREENKDLEMGVADMSNQIETIQKSVEEKRTELVQRYQQVTKEMEQRIVSAKKRMKKKMKMRITSLEGHLHELKDLKKKTELRLSAFSKLSPLASDDAIIFLMKLKELQIEIGPVTGDYIKRGPIVTECDSSLPVEQLMDEIIASAIRPSERRLQFPDTKPTGRDILPKHVKMAVKVTNVQKAGMMSADVKWSTTSQASQYEVSYSCSPNETVVLKNIAGNGCILTNLRWDSTYTIKVTTQLQDGSTIFDEHSFKTDPQVKYTKPTGIDTLPKHVKMAVKVTNVQKAGMMSADVKWSTTSQASQYEVSYSCSPNETVVLKNIAGNGCILTNLRWDSTYTINVTTQLQDGSTIFDEHSFKTDPQVKCLQMAVSKICTKKVLLLNSFNGFKASNKIYNWSYFQKEGEFSGIVVTPLLTEDRSFWTMKLELSIFEAGEIKDIFLDFGIINYSDIKDSECLTNNKMAYSCTVLQKEKQKFHLEFTNRLSTEVLSNPLPLKLHEKSIFCFGFLYDSIKCQFAVMDCQTKEVLHLFHDVIFDNDDAPVFAIYSSHTIRKMRTKIMLDYMHCTNEDISYWMQKIDKFYYFTFED